MKQLKIYNKFIYIIFSHKYYSKIIYIKWSIVRSTFSLFSKIKSPTVNTMMFIFMSLLTTYPIGAKSNESTKQKPKTCIKGTTTFFNHRSTYLTTWKTFYLYRSPCHLSFWINKGLLLWLMHHYHLLLLKLRLLLLRVLLLLLRILLLLIWLLLILLLIIRL